MAPQYCVMFYGDLHPCRLNVQNLYHDPDRLNVLSVAILADALPLNVFLIQWVPRKEKGKVIKNKGKFNKILYLESKLYRSKLELN